MFVTNSMLNWIRGVVEYEKETADIKSLGTTAVNHSGLTTDMKDFFVGRRLRNATVFAGDLQLKREY